MSLKLGIQHQVLEYYQVCSNDDPALTLTYFAARSNLIPYALVRENIYFFRENVRKSFNRRSLQQITRVTNVYVDIEICP